MSVIITDEGQDDEGQDDGGQAASVALAAGAAGAVAEQAADDAAEAADAADLAADLAEDATQNAWDARMAVDELRAELGSALEEMRAGLAAMAALPADSGIPVPERIGNDGNESEGTADKPESGGSSHETDSKPRVSYGHTAWFGKG